MRNTISKDDILIGLTEQIRDELEDLGADCKLQVEDTLTEAAEIMYDMTITCDPHEKEELVRRYAIVVETLEDIENYMEISLAQKVCSIMGWVIVQILKGAVAAALL